MGTSGKSRSASKNNYFAGGATRIPKNKARRAASRKRRADYWKSAEGQARKAEKMNTPEKIEGRKQWKTARDQRRRERLLASQEKAREEARKSADEQVKKD